MITASILISESAEHDKWNVINSNINNITSQAEMSEYESYKLKK